MRAVSHTALCVQLFLFPVAIFGPQEQKRKDTHPLKFPFPTEKVAVFFKTP